MAQVTLQFSKGHGTGNDFVIIPDGDAALSLSGRDVAALCHRRFGIGADGVLRAVTVGAALDKGLVGEDAAEGASRDGWFMDYRNADGSIAEVCGNGLRVFAHWLLSHGHVDRVGFPVVTRAGVRTVEVVECDGPRATVAVDMGPVRTRGVSTARLGSHEVAGLGIEVGNPHLAAVIPGLSPDELSNWELGEPELDRSFFPEGANVELVTPLADDAVTMRVWERGVGETWSCGTGTVAAAQAALADSGVGTGTVSVHVPGGVVRVVIMEDPGLDIPRARLIGPSRLVADGIWVLGG